MEKKAQPPPPAVTVDASSDVSADAILESLRRLPEGWPKEREKERLLRTRFRDLLPSRPAGRPRKHDMAALTLVVEAPLFRECLRAKRRTLRRQPHLEQHGLVSRPAGRETTEQHVQRITPLVLAAWREHREALWPGEGSPKDPPEDVLVSAIRAAIARQKQHSAPDLAELAARLLAWRWGLSPRPRAIRKLIDRGVALRKVGPRKALRTDSYF